MRATVITPSGERLEGVTGDLLEYYKGEAEVTPGYQLQEELDEAEAFPQVWEGGQRVDQPQQVELLPEGQAFQTDGTVRESDGATPLPDATGQVVDTTVTPNAGSDGVDTSPNPAPPA